jgi:CRISPR-associated endoribonuclease Cas6
MRVTLEFGSEKRLSLPIQYNYTVQGFLYGNITSELGEFLHDQGFGMVAVINDGRDR